MTNDTIALLNSEIFYKTVGDHATMLPEKIRYTLPTQTGTLMPTTCVDYTYDANGNIKNISYTGYGNSMTYTYDKFNRLIREDDKELRRTMVYTYDGDGNITSKQQMVYQTETPAPGVNAITYTYSNGKMTAYNGLVCSYDAVGNPTVYKGQRATWTKGRKLTSYRNATFTYDGRGRRISKNSTTYTYDSADRLIKTSNGMEFFYDQEGVAGFTYGGAKYCYQKDLQGNIIGIIDNAGQVVVQYKYDAWGVPRSIATASSNYSTIASLNPFRYRGYIYDSETGFYYLQTRYYDPETCRFLNMDSVDYADPETLNGLNLYAYGLNNPVMYVDPTGHFVISIGVYLGSTFALLALAAVLIETIFHPLENTVKAVVGLVDNAVDSLTQLKNNEGTLGNTIKDEEALNVSNVQPIPLLSDNIFLSRERNRGRDSGFIGVSDEKLEELLEEAKRKGDTQEVKRILNEMKKRGLRNKRKQRGGPHMRGFWLIFLLGYILNERYEQ